MNHLHTTKMLRKGRSAVVEQSQDRSNFTLAKAMILASTEFKQRSGINSAATFLMDGHCVDLSEELVEQKPSILRSEEWDTSLVPTPPPSQAAPGTIRVCWQCPEEHKIKKSRLSLKS